MDSVELRLASMKSLVSQGGTWWDSTNVPLVYDLCGKSLQAAYLVTSGRSAEVDPQWNGGCTPWPPELDPLHGRASRPVHTVGSPRLTYWVPVPCDVVPQAYLARGMVDSALSAYQMAVNRNADLFCPVIPRYYYRLARLYDQEGMKEQAIENYTRFLKIWRKADPSYQEPKDARARLERLEKG